MITLSEINPQMSQLAQIVSIRKNIGENHRNSLPFGDLRINSGFIAGNHFGGIHAN
jgi:hypothetical protein